jgi:hypothetical protein
LLANLQLILAIVIVPLETHSQMKLLDKYLYSSDLTEHIFLINNISGGTIHLHQILAHLKGMIS